MGRPSKLNQKQLDEIDRRLRNGESIRSLARVFDVNEAAIRQRFSTHLKKSKNLANQIVAAENEIKNLPLSTQIATHEEINKLRAISANLGCAAHNNALTARSLSDIAVKQIEKVNQDDPMESSDVLQGIAALTKLSNDAGSLGMALIAASARAKQDATDNTITISNPRRFEE